MPGPTLAPPLPAVLAPNQPSMLPKASQGSPMPLGPGTDDKWLLMLPLCKLRLLLCLVPASPDGSGRGEAGSGHDYVAWLRGRGGGWAGVMLVLPSPLACLPSSWDCRSQSSPVLLPVLRGAAGTKAALWAGELLPDSCIWSKHPGLSKVLLPFCLQGWAVLAMAALGLFWHMAARFGESSAGVWRECLGALGMDWDLSSLG